MASPRRRGAYWALLCWLVLILIGFGSQRLGRPRRLDGRAEAAWARLQEGLLEREQARAEGERQRLLEGAGERIAGFTPLPCRLLAIPDPSPQRRSALIDAGSAEGVRPGLGVICAWGVVGRVAEVGKSHSRIMLADDPAFRVLFEVEGKGRGFASGGPQEGELSPILRLDPLTLEVGDLLVTAGDEIFPRALVVGTITDRKLPLAANRIEAPEDPRRAREVLVLVPPRLTAER